MAIWSHQYSKSFPSYLTFHSVAKLVRWLGSGSLTFVISAAFADLNTDSSMLASYSSFAGFQTVTTWNGQWPWRYLCLRWNIGAPLGCYLLTFCHMSFYMAMILTDASDPYVSTADS
ncbi:hypothetical protein ATANTOWER_027665 [Ataeniobius toweri]|uniref:Uncharacterized protein n=1 Tax=Ataeniobius toweri TaxID=208326 RepID=A0ABU7ASV6_9TELE|nr:hypothetical protein [Ataeniobius toweri]